MKNYIFFSIILCSFINPIFAQFSQGIVNAGNISFMCDSSSSRLANGFEIKNTNNQIFTSEMERPNLPPKPLDCYSLIAQISPEEIQAIFRQAFTPTRRQILINERVDLFCYLRRIEGKIKEVYFDIAQNTQITPQELAQLETLIKQKHFPQPSNVCQSAEYLLRGLIIKFKDL